MANFWTSISGTTIASIEENVTTTIPLPLSQPDATVTFLSGTLPKGMRIKDNTLQGTPSEVARVTDYKFALRASYNNEISDRTYIVTVSGPDAPEWISEEGLLPVGPNNTFYILDSSPIDFQLLVNDPDTAAGEVLEFYIGSGDGTLPPGIQLTNDGRLVGVVDPILAIEKKAGNGSYDTGPYDSRSNPFDFGIKSSNGFDSFFYDTTIYDLSIPTKSPKKLNRYYEFTVSVSDGDTIARRTFRIFVVGDDFLRTDNTIMQVGTGVFTADNTHIRTPIWLTPRNFGIRRANNYLTLYLDVIDPNTLSGVVTYTLQDVNDDGSESILPPGMDIDSTTGEIAGRVPYQPSVNKEYKFSVKASRYGPTSNKEVVTINIYEDSGIGASTIKINKNPDTDSLVGQTISFEGISYIVQTVDTSPLDFDILNLGTPLSIFMYETTPIGGTSLKVNKLGRPTLGKLVGKKINFGAQFVDITSINYNEKVYKARQTHRSTAFGADLGRAVWEEVPGANPDNYNIWTEDSDYNKDDFVKFNASAFEIINIKDPVQLNLYAGLRSDTSLDTPLESIVRKDTLYNITTVSNIELEVAESTKTFTVTLLGDVNSEINFTTPSNLGTISSNYVSTLLIEATTTVTNGNVLFSLIKGNLPPGLTLSYDGSITGKINQFGDSTKLGITTFDNNTFTLDGNDTRLDRKFTFTVKAQDQFLYSAKEQEFSITILDPDNIAYSDLTFKPFLKKEQRRNFKELVSNPEIFEPERIYRPFDPFFGVQNEIKMLMYAGIETKEIAKYMSAITKNHKRKRFKLGEIKTAVAKTPGTNNIVYEVVYLEVIDPLLPKKGKTKKDFRITTQNKITVDESQDDQDRNPVVGLSIASRNGTLPGSFSGGRLIIEQRYDTLRVGTDNEVIIELRDGTEVTIGAITNYTQVDLTAPYRLPNNPTNLIKADTDAITVGNSKDQLRYISNVYNMRDNIRQLGITERNFLPLWMRTAQENSVQELGWIPAIPICYTKPGNSKIIANNIAQLGFDFQQFDFDIDRYIIDNTTGKSGDQFLLFANYQFNV